MSASITLSGLGWSTPDGRAVLSNLDLGFGAERTGIVGRNGTGKTTLLRLLSGNLRPTTGQAIVRGRVGLLRQMTQPGAGESIADLFGVSEALNLLRRAEAGLATLDELDAADWTLEARIEAALALLGLEAAPETPLVRLSGGQRTRAALAGVVFAAPDFLLLDEPTNHLDREGRGMVLDLLAGWTAGAIVVSHDRELLETMDAIVELTTLGASRYGGNWSHYRQQKANELATARHELAVAQRQVEAVERRAQAMTERKQQSDAAGRRKGGRGDMPRILIGARRNRAEGTGGDHARLAERQRAQAADASAAARARIERLEPLAIMLEPTGLPAGRTVVEMRGVTVGHVPGKPVLRDLSLVMVGPERVAVTGPNGSGKTTLIDLLTGRLRPWAGSVRVPVRFALLDQYAGILDPAASVAENYARLNPGADLNGCRAALARFQFRAEAALRIVSTLSGGQMLRAALACVLGGPTPPPLLVLDEPTNHLDLESVEILEAGLAAYDGAMLVVSHDEAFLDAIGLSRRLELKTDG